MKKLLIISMAVVISAGALYLSASNALAYKGDPNVQGPNYTPERHEAMTKAFETGDFNAWKELMGVNTRRGKVTEAVDTQEKFDRFAKMHQLRLEGKTAEADQIRAELGLGQGKGAGKQGGAGRGQGMDCVRNAN